MTDTNDLDRARLRAMLARCGHVADEALSLREDVPEAYPAIRDALGEAYAKSMAAIEFATHALAEGEGTPAARVEAEPAGKPGLQSRVSVADPPSVARSLREVVVLEFSADLTREQANAEFRKTLDMLEGYATVLSGADAADAVGLNRPSWSDLHATIVDLMRTYYQDPAGFHEALAEHLDIAEEEYEPVRQFRIDAIPEDALRTLEHVVDAELDARREYLRHTPSDEQSRRVEEMERARATLDDAHELR